MSESLSRDELIEKVADAIDQLWTSERCLAGACAECAAEVALEVFAAAVADDLEAQSEPRWDAWMKSEGLAAHRHAQTWTTYRTAAERVRGLLGKDTTNE